MVPLVVVDLVQATHYVLLPKDLTGISAPPNPHSFRSFHLFFILFPSFLPFFQAAQPQRFGEPAAPPHQHLPRPHHHPLLPQLGRMEMDRMNEIRERIGLSTITPFAQHITKKFTSPCDPELLQCDLNHILYRDRLKSWYVVWWNLSLPLLS